jgi:hypothetical protein
VLFRLFGNFKNSGFEQEHQPVFKQEAQYLKPEKTVNVCHYSDYIEYGYTHTEIALKNLSCIIWSIT